VSYFLFVWLEWISAHHQSRDACMDKAPRRTRRIIQAPRPFSHASRLVPLHPRRPRRHRIHKRHALFQPRYVPPSSFPFSSLSHPPLSAVHLVYEEKPIFGKPPSARGYHVCILADSRLFFFGGYNGSLAFDDVYIVDLAASSYLPQVTSFKIEI
jgi:hypothetical protein